MDNQLSKCRETEERIHANAHVQPLRSTRVNTHTHTSEQAFKSGPLNVNHDVTLHERLLIKCEWLANASHTRIHTFASH